MNRFSIAKLCVSLTIAGLFVPAALAAKYSSYDKSQVIAASPFYFGNIDVNHDGYISRSEVPEALNDLRMHFNQYDRGKHRISETEYAWYLQSVTTPPCVLFTSSDCARNQRPFLVTR